MKIRKKKKERQNNQSNNMPWTKYLCHPFLNLYVWSVNPQCIWKWALWEIIRSWGWNTHEWDLCLYSDSEVAQSCPTLCDPMDCSLPDFSVHGIFQARVLEWVAISFSRESSQPRDRTQVSCIVGRRFTLWARKPELSLLLAMWWYNQKTAICKPERGPWP